MKIYTQTYDLSKASPHRFWVAPYSEFKIGIKLLEKDEISDKDFTLKAGSVEFTPDEDKIDNFTLFTIKSNDTGFVEYTIEVEGVAEKLKLMQIVTDSTVFEIDAGGGGDVPADVATKTWVNSQISDFITDDALNGYATEDYVDSAISDFVTDDELTGYATKAELTAYAETADLTAYATKAELTGYVENGDLTAYYTKSETSSATELADAFAGAGGGGAISAFDMSESPVWSKTQVEAAVANDICLPQTLVHYNDNSLSVLDVSGELNIYGVPKEVNKLLIGTKCTSYKSFDYVGYCPRKTVIPSTVSAVTAESWLNGLNNSSPIIIPDTVVSMQSIRYSDSAFPYMDFGNTRTSMPTITNPAVIPGSGRKYYVPDALYDTVITTAPWSSITSMVHRHSELEAPYATNTALSALTAANSKVTGGAETGTTGTPAAIEAVKSVYESDWATLSATADANTFYVVLADPE